jgi:hypothetical protein
MRTNHKFVFDPDLGCAVCTKCGLGRMLDLPRKGFLYVDFVKETEPTNKLPICKTNEEKKKC